jgi:hypothetical protein
VRIRLLATLLVVLTLGAIAWFGWRWGVQTVNLVIVNASGLPAQLSWQPLLFAEEERVAIGGCESKSIVLRAGERWHLAHDRLEMNSSVVDVPLLAPDVAVEIWLAADGSSRYVPAYPIDAALNAPPPTGCAITP